MYFNINAKYYHFTYKNELYHSGTKLIFNGKCFLGQNETILNNQMVTWLYDQGGDVYFSDDVNTYTCKQWNFVKRIVQIVPDVGLSIPTEQKTEVYWTEDMVTKTLWYIIIMLVAVIFYERIGIWILATIIWYTSTFKKKN